MGEAGTSLPSAVTRLPVLPGTVQHPLWLSTPVEGGRLETESGEIEVNGMVVQNIGGTAIRVTEVYVLRDLRPLHRGKSIVVEEYPGTARLDNGHVVPGVRPANQRA